MALLLSWTRVTADDRWEDRLPGLSPFEQAEADRYAIPAARQAYIAAHTLLQAHLGPGRRLRRASSGQLTVVGGDIAISLSHGRGLAAAAVTSHGAVGIDIEAGMPPAWVDDVVAASLTSVERAWLDLSADATIRAERLLVLWTLKESVLKATGQGLAADPRSFAVAGDPPRLLTRGPDGSDCRRWRLDSTALGGGRAAVALRRGDLPADRDGAIEWVERDFASLGPIDPSRAPPPVTDHPEEIGLR